MTQNRLQLPQSPDQLSSDLDSLLACDQQRATHKVWAAYARISVEDKHRIQYSKETQPDQAEAYAKKHGSSSVVVYKDWDVSGKNSKRPEFQRLRKDIIAGRIDVVVVHRLDRLYRNLESQLGFIRLLKKYNVELVSVTEKIELQTWWGRLVLYVLGALAEMYVWQTSERTRDALMARFRKGLSNGDLRLGYCNGLCSTCSAPNGPGYCPQVGDLDRPESERGRIPVPHPIDRYAILWITHSYNNGMSFMEIADTLNFHDFTLPDGERVHFRTRGQRSERARPLAEQNRLFKRDSIRVIVCSPFYAGLVARYARPDFSLDDDINHPERIPVPRIDHNPREIQEMHPGLHQALIPAQLWEQNQVLRKGRAKTPSNARRQVRRYPLTGVGRCWECFEHAQRQENLRGSAKQDKRYYRCALTQRSVKTRSGKPHEDLAMLGMGVYVIDGKQQILKRHKMLHAKVLESQLDAWMSRVVIPPAWHETIMAYYLSDDGLAAFEYEGHNLRQALARYQQLYLGGRLSKADLEIQTLYLTRQLNALKPSLRPESGQVQPLVSDFSALWLQLTNPERRRVLDIFFAGLYFDRDGNLRKIAAHSPFDHLLGLPEGGITLEI